MNQLFVVHLWIFLFLRHVVKLNLVSRTPLVAAAVVQLSDGYVDKLTNIVRSRPSSTRSHSCRSLCRTHTLTSHPRPAVLYVWYFYCKETFILKCATFSYSFTESIFSVVACIDNKGSWLEFHPQVKVFSSSSFVSQASGRQQNLTWSFQTRFREIYIF